MASDNKELVGPDLQAGVTAAELPPGTLLLGHAGGEAIVLANVAGEFLAIGAVCSHYSGPLAEGLLIGDEIRCPWHHACFSLRTGDALRAPAMNPVASWTVERQGERIRVVHKVLREPLSPTPFPAARGGPRPQSIVVIGSGAAGSAAVEMLRRQGYDGRLVMIDEEVDAPYDRPNLSKDYLAGNAAEEWIPLRAPEFYREHGVDDRRGVQATSIDVAGKRVTLAGGEAVNFDRLLLATGAEPVQLQIPGGAGRVRYLRSLDDSRGIIRAATGAKNAVVIGASFIGLEVAASLRARGLNVAVVGPEARPLERVFGAELGDFVRALHEEQGVRFHLQRTVASIDDHGLTLSDGTAMSADLIVAGIGVRPRLRLAEAAGLATDRGLVVDSYLESSAAGIFGAGDIARWPDIHSEQNIRVEHWVVAQRQGQTAARNMLGARERFESVPFFWSAHYDVTIAYVGHAERWDRTEIHGALDRHEAAVSFYGGTRLLALATIFRDRESLETEARLEGALLERH